MAWDKLKEVKPWVAAGSKRAPGRGVEASSFAPFQGLRTLDARTHGLRRGLFSFALTGFLHAGTPP